MRPRELTLEGFRSYRGRTTFDLRGRRLIGVVGPIGSGKSSLLDALAFALYGKTPTFEKATRSLIHQLADVAKVQLVFEVDEQIWRVTRAQRRKGQSPHKLERLADDEPDAAPVETVTGDKETTRRIVRLLGLDFKGFCRSVLLAQNRFAELLRATPTQRNDVLKGAFGYERFDVASSIAKERAAAADGERTAIEDEAGRLLEARAALEQASAAATAANERAAAFDRRRGAVEAHGATLAQARAAGTAIATRRGGLEAALERLPPPHAVETLTLEASQADERLRHATVKVIEAEQVLAATQAVRDELDSSAADLRAFEELVARHDALANGVARAAEAREGATAVVTDADAALTRATADLDAATEAQRTADEDAAKTRRLLDAATLRLHEVRHADMATELRRHVTVGTTCPVCERVIEQVPPPGAASAIDDAVEGERAAAARAAAAQEMRTRAAAAHAAAARGMTEAHGSLEQARGRLDRAETDEREREAALAAAKSEIVDRLGDGDPRALLDEREQQLRRAEADLKAATDVVAAARREVEDARVAGERASAEVIKLASRLTSTWGQIGETVEVEATAEAVRSGAAGIAAELAARVGRAAADLDEAKGEQERVLVALAGELAALGLAPDADYGDERSAALAARAAAAQRVAGLEEVIAAAADLDVRLAEAIERRDVARRVAADLQPSRLLAFVLEEERATLAELGSVHLEELTAGDYRFADDDSFDIVDVNAGGAVRGADSLSGGETFLASLALALALAEMVTRGGGRLDAFLLDEGFGSLDEEHLDRAMDGIGRLVAGDTGRLVVLVSHVEQMRSMLEDLIVLGKDGRTGDTVVLSGAGPV